MGRHFRDSHTRKRMASAHAKHGLFCACGKRVYGNGGMYQHRAMHERRGEKFIAMTSRDWFAKFEPDTITTEGFNG